MYCPECGKQNKENARFCRFCGTRIGENTGTDTTRFDFVKKRKWKIWMLIIAILLLLVAAGISIAFILKEQNAKQQIEGFLAEGNRYLEELDYEKAEDFYLRAIDIAPKEKEPYLRLAELYLEKGDIESARDIIRQAQDNVADSDKEEFESLEKDYENLVSYTWIVEPKIEADDIYYLRDHDECSYSSNELERQKFSDYAVIRQGDKVGLIRNDGTMAGEVVYDDIYVTASISLENPYILRVQSDTENYYLDETAGILEREEGGDGPDIAGIGGIFYFCGQLYNIKETYEDVYEVDMGGNLPPTQKTIPVKQSESIFDSSVSGDAWTWYEELPEVYAVYSNGELVTDFVYEECGSESSGLLAVKQDEKWGYVNESGEVVIPLEYDASWEQYIFNYGEAKDYCYAASEGYVPLVKDGVWEMRNTEGVLVIAPGVFDEILPVYNHKCWVKKDGKWGVIQVGEQVQSDDTVEKSDDEKPQNWKSEEELRNSLESTASDPVRYFAYDDYDGDGVLEAFAVTSPDESDELGLYNDIDIWYVDCEGNCRVIIQDIYGYPHKTIMEAGKQKFMVWEKSAGGSGSVSYIVGLRNGAAYEPQISEEYMDFQFDGDIGCYVGYTSDFSKGYHDYLPTEFLFDEETGEFIAQ